MLPPIGFLGSAWKLIVAPGSDVIWLVTNTAKLYSSDSFCNLRFFISLQNEQRWQIKAQF